MKNMTSSLLPLVLLAAMQHSALANELDTWNIVGGISVTRDNNLFRLSNSADTQALLRTTSRSETITATNIGLKFNKPVSLQRFEFDLGVTDYHYQNFSYLNFAGINYNAAWRWNLTPNLTGNLTSSRQQTLMSFLDYNNYTTRNLRTIEQHRFDADFNVGGGWHLTGGAFQSTYRNSQPFVQESDTTLDSAEAGVKYRFTSGSDLSFVNRTGRGVFINRPEPIYSSQLDNKYSQTENELRFRWLTNPKANIDTKLAYLERKHDNFSERDFHGMTGGLSAEWLPTAKTSIKGGWSHELGSYQSLTTNYVATDRLFINPAWQISSKTVLRLRYEYARRDYLGAIVSNPYGDRSDTLKTGSVEFGWQPITNLSLSASVTSASRTSNQTGYDFKSTAGYLNALVNF